MIKYNSHKNYDLNPCVQVSSNSSDALVGNLKLVELIKSQIESGNKVFALDLYPGVEKNQIISLLKNFENSLLIDTDTYKLTEEELHKRFDKNITDDRVFGFMVKDRLENCFRDLSEVKLKIKQNQDQVIFIVGVGASLFTKAQICYYFDITRWEIQLRFRKGTPNWMFSNSDSPILTKYKIGFFVEWRLADSHKEENFNSIDYWVDANNPNELKIINKQVFRNAFKKISAEPFRMEPYFDKSVWGGQWMKNMFGLEENADNFGWSFDGVPEENSLRLVFGKNSLVFPTMNLVKLFPQELLGKRVDEVFGAEFPIRFDMLDTFEGGNLSLQVHPVKDYIRSTFGMTYTQDESYYILDAAEDSCVYIGLKENVDKEKMIADLHAANRGEIIFDADKYINKIPVKKHDHVLIPAGTVHCSGKNTQVLEISATPYIFTFKLWDWGQIGLDGLPRPVHINHGKKNIQWDRDTKWVMDNLIHREEIIEKTEAYTVEHTGLHELEFIETQRYTTNSAVEIKRNGSVAVINLVEGDSAQIKSSTKSWAEKIIHYGETFIVPQNAGDFFVEAEGGEMIKAMVATVRNQI